jgi:hypothetical protein
MDIQDLVDGVRKSLGDGSVDQLVLKESNDTILKWANVIIGLFTTIILILVPIIIALEVVYIAFPITRDKMDRFAIWVEQKAANPLIAGVTLRDAREAVTRANIGAVGNRSAFWIYMTMKVKSIMFVFFLLAIIVKGSGYLFDTVIRLLGNVINQMFG